MHRFIQAFFNSGNKLFGDSPADNFINKEKTLPLFCR